MIPTFSPEWFLVILPEILLVVLLAAVLLYDRFLTAETRRNVGLMTAWGAFAILVVTMGLWLIWGIPDPLKALTTQSLYWGGMVRNDLITLVFRVMFLLALMLTSLVTVDVKRLQRGEFYALLIAATVGFSLMAASADLIMLYIALETASISSYVLAGFITEDEESTEAGMKYFVYGAVATGLMLYGMSLLHGTFSSLGVATTNFYEMGLVIANAGTIPPEANGVLLLAAAFMIVGFGFKISAVPFHFWTPDVYQGAPTSFTAFVSTASKAAGFAVFLRVFSAGAFGAPGQQSLWWALLISMCVITMTLGNMAAIFQNNIKRMLAYSSIAQAGYALIGLVAVTPDGSGAVDFYLLMYVFTNIAAFGVIILISNVSGSNDMRDLYGLNRRSPYLALVMLFALLSLGGIPPTAGFIGKFFIFKAAVDAGYWWLAMVGILNAFIALYYYLNVVKYMYLYRSDEEDVVIPISRAAQMGLGVSLFFILFLGVYAGPAYDWTREEANAFFNLVVG